MDEQFLCEFQICHYSWIGDWWNEEEPKNLIYYYLTYFRSEQSKGLTQHLIIVQNAWYSVHLRHTPKASCNSAPKLVSSSPSFLHLFFFFLFFFYLFSFGEFFLHSFFVSLIFGNWNFIIIVGWNLNVIVGNRNLVNK